MVFRAGLVVPVGPGGFSWFTERSNACGQLRQGAPDHSCFQTTGCSTAHGSGGLNLVSDALRSSVLICG